MAKTTEYRLVISSDQDAFERDVNEALGEGWELYGSPIIRSAHGMGPLGIAGSVFYCQPMIRTAADGADD